MRLNEFFFLYKRKCTHKKKGRGCGTKVIRLLIESLFSIFTLYHCHVKHIYEKKKSHRLLASAVLIIMCVYVLERTILRAA